MTTNQDQLSLLGQRCVLNEWIVHAQNDAPARRSDMQAAQFLSELAYISIIEASDDELMFRLGGSHLRRILGCELRGRSVREIDAVFGEGCWSRTVQETLSQARPLVGMRPLQGSDLVHCWLRLPLKDDHDLTRVVFCHDRIVEADKLAAGLAEKDDSATVLNFAA